MERVMHEAIQLKTEAFENFEWSYIWEHNYDASEAVRWYALLVEAGQERKACIWLRMRQFKPYWARYRSENRLHANRRNIRWKSVIPGYLFLPMPFMRGLSSDYFQFAPGIRGFMRRASGNVVELKPDEMSKIKEIEEALQASAIAAVEGIPFKEGQIVRVEKLGVSGKILRIDSRRKILVEVPMFGSKVPVNLTVNEIEAT